MLIQDLLKKLYAIAPRESKGYQRAARLRNAHYYKIGYILDIKLSRLLDVLDSFGFDLYIVAKPGNKYMKEHGFNRMVKVETSKEKEIIAPPKKVPPNYGKLAVEYERFFDERNFKRYVNDMIVQYADDGEYSENNEHNEHNEHSEHGEHNKGDEVNETGRDRKTDTKAD